MRTGSSDFMDGFEITREESTVDWLNLPTDTAAFSLWDGLHDAQVVSIQSSLLERTMDLVVESGHLTRFHKFAEAYRFTLRLEGVQSARVLGYAIWPGGFSTSSGASAEEQKRMVSDYQAKWRQESGSWSEFETKVTRDNEQVFDISDAAIAKSPNGSHALKIYGHLNYSTFHEVYLRFDNLRILGSDGKLFTIEEFQRLGQLYWEAFSKRDGSSVQAE
jgi:hypothetical protein